jgi:hypothetical protein
MPKHQLDIARRQQKLYLCAAEGTLQQELAALCNAGVPVGLRSIHDRPRLSIVSMKKKESFLEWEKGGKYLYLRAFSVTTSVGGDDGGDLFVRAVLKGCRHGRR